jgi:hypothetical protein
VLLLNRDETSAKLSVSWEELGLPVGAKMSVRNIARNKNEPPAVGRFEATVEKHDVAFVRLKPANY